MNQIKATFEKSEYSKVPHLTIEIDGTPLDKYLDQFYPENNYIGLVPTLLDWLTNPDERRVVWERIESENKQIVPILMCPDDVDLWCTIINVEVEKTENSVKWLKIGIDIGGCGWEGMPDSIGTNVSWFDKIEPLEFERKQYEQFVSIFKLEIEKDEI